MICVMDGQDFCYHVGGRTAIGIRRCDPEFSAETFQQYRVGLHHLCLRAKSRDDVDRTYELLTQINAKVVRGPEEPRWNSDRGKFHSWCWSIKGGRRV